MTDFDYDCYLKKQVAHSAVRKKNGSRSKRCTLPSDILTNAQRKKLNGKVVTYKMGSPMTWKEYKDLPDDLKKQYLDNLISKYDVGSKQIAEMLGVSCGTLSKNLPTAQGFSFRKAHRMNRSMLEAWNRFLTGEPEQKEKPAEEAPVENPVSEQTGQTADAAEQESITLDVRLAFTGGQIDPSKIADALTVLRCVAGVRLGEVHVRWFDEKREKDDWRF